MTGNHVIPTARAGVRAQVNGTEHVFSSVGNGPVDASFKAIVGIIPAEIQLTEFNIEAISGGSDAMCHVTIAVEDEHGRIYDASGSGDDIVLASVDALVNAIAARPAGRPGSLPDASGRIRPCRPASRSCSGHAVDPDLVRRELHRHGAGQIGDAALGGRIGDRARAAERSPRSSRH